MKTKRLGSVAFFGVLAMTGAVPRSQAATCAVTYQGGPVVSNIEVVEVFWTSSVATAAQDVLPGFFSSVLNSSYLDWLSEYDTVGLVGGSNQFIGRGTFKRQVTITPATSSTKLTTAQVEAELEAQLAAGILPAPSFDGVGRVNTFYAVDFPPGVQITDDFGNASCVSFCGSWGQVHVGGNFAPFGVFPDITTGPCVGGCGNAPNVADNITTVHSLILLNVITDPLVSESAGPFGWLSPSNSGTCVGDIADICLGKTGTVGAYTVAKGWSNRQATCVLGGPATPICTSALGSSCRGCTESDDGAGCAGATPLCDTKPKSATYGLCIANTPDAGAPDASSAADAAAITDAAVVGACVPGQQVACACIGGGAGVQACATSGAGYGACQCPDAGAPAKSSSGSSGCTMNPTPTSSFGLLAALAAMLVIVRRRAGSR